ncbi:MAG: helix-turn-helix domain-containing protein [Methanotrichaceae archaeon]|nr:helix-turn-helix domain-containing protein [Methanotrichaceae archaeon]
MDPIELLDILGNENRRRILQLLSFRPFYFNEIAKRLDVGPKAVIDHLEMLEKAGLVECYQDQKRRKYFRIARKTVIEVAVSPHTYGVRVYKSEDVSPDRTGRAQDMSKLRQELSHLEAKRSELRKMLDEIESRELEIKNLAAGAIVEKASDLLEAEILIALLSGRSSSAALADKLEVPLVVVEDCLRRLKAEGAVQLRDKEWSA